MYNKNNIFLSKDLKTLTKKNTSLKNSNRNSH